MAGQGTPMMDGLFYGACAREEPKVYRTKNRSIERRPGHKAR